MYNLYGGVRIIDVILNASFKMRGNSELHYEGPQVTITGLAETECLYSINCYNVSGKQCLKDTHKVSESSTDMCCWGR
jgi:hypothetical protein